MNDSVFQVMVIHQQYHKSIREAIAEFYGVPSIAISEYTVHEQKEFRLGAELVLSLNYKFVQDGDSYFMKNNILCSKQLGAFLRTKGLINDR